MITSSRLLRIVALAMVLCAASAVADSPSPGTAPLATITTDTRYAFEGTVGTLPDALGFQDRYHFIDPMIDLVLGMQVPGGPEISVRGEWVAEYYRAHVFNLPDPRSYNPSGFETNNVTGYLRLPWSWGSASVGRQSLHLGAVGFSSLMVSDRIPYLDSIILKVGLGPLNFTQVIATIENKPAVPDVDTSSSDFKFITNTILYVARYFDYSFGRFSLAFGTGVVIARRDNAFFLADLFPIFSYHNANVGPNNLSINVDLRWQLDHATRLFASFGVDEVDPSFGLVATAGPPTTPGVVLGVAWEQPNRVGLRGELGYTHYLWGSFFDDEALMRAVWRRDAEVTHQSMPLTSPYGPGAIWASGDARWQALPALSLSAEATAIVWDPRADLYAGAFTDLPLPAVPWPFSVRAAIAGALDLPLGFRLRSEVGMEVEPSGLDWYVELTGSWRGHTEVVVGS